MSFGNILGQVLQNGLGGQRQTRGRVDTSARNLDQAGGGLGDIFKQLQGAVQGGGASSSRAGGASGLAEAARTFLGKEQAGGMTGGQIGGIGAAAGALLGGGLGGAARGGALAILGTLAIGALRKSQEGGSASGQNAISDHEVATLTSPETEKLLLRAMISAANADGRIDPTEMRNILGKLDDASVTEAERETVLAEMDRPLTAQEVAAQVDSRAQAAEVYAAALIAIDVNTDAERAYLRQLAHALNLDTATIAHLHDMTGAPAV